MIEQQIKKKTPLFPLASGIGFQQKQIPSQVVLAFALIRCGMENDEGSVPTVILQQAVAVLAGLHTSRRRGAFPRGCGLKTLSGRETRPAGRVQVSQRRSYPIPISSAVQQSPYRYPNRA